MKTKIIFEDKHILVCHKPAGIATQTDRLGQQDVVSELKNYMKNPYIGLIHRLDQPVEGLLVFAKTEQAATRLGKQLLNGQLQKKYYAVVTGTDLPESEVLVDYMLKDGKTNTSKVVPEQTKGVKRAELSYRVVWKAEEYTLTEVELVTGRHHQIRVQMAQNGHPLLGDSKYKNDTSVMLSEKYHVKNVALCAYKLAFVHPVSGKQMSYEIEPTAEIFQESE